MGIFSKPKVKAEQTQDTTASTEEAKETAAKNKDCWKPRAVTKVQNFKQIKAGL